MGKFWESKQPHKILCKSEKIRYDNKVKISKRKYGRNRKNYITCTRL